MSIASPLDPYSFITSATDTLLTPSVDELAVPGPDSGLGSEGSPHSYRNSPDTAPLPSEEELEEALFGKKNVGFGLFLEISQIPLINFLTLMYEFFRRTTTLIPDSAPDSTLLPSRALRGLPPMSLILRLAVRPESSHSRMNLLTCSLSTLLKVSIKKILLDS